MNTQIDSRGGSRPDILVWLKKNTFTNFIVEKKMFNVSKLAEEVALSLERT
jgi:hypothetical protein